MNSTTSRPSHAPRSRAARSLIGLMVAVALVASACGSKGSKSAAGPGVTSTEIKLGAYLPLTGPGATAGLAQQAGTQAYFNLINDQGGINGRKIKWITYDDAYNPSQTVAVVKKLVDDDKVLFITNGVGAPTTLAALPYLQQQKVPILGLQVQATPDMIDPPKPNTYFVGVPVADQAKYEVKYLIEKKGCKNPGLMFQLQNQAGDAAKVGYESEIKARNLKVIEVGWTSADLDLKSQIFELQRQGADCIAGGATAAGNASVGRTLKELNLPWSVMASTALLDSNTIKLGGAAVEGITGFFWTKSPADPTDPDVKQYRDAMAKYQANANALNPVIINAYASAKVVVEVLKLMGNDLTRENMIKVLETKAKNVKTGLYAPISYSKTNHTGISQLHIAEIKNGNYVEVAGSPVTVAAA